MGKCRRQIGGGPALGMFQMEPITHEDCWDRIIPRHPGLAEEILKVSGLSSRTLAQELAGNDEYAICMCRVKYLGSSLPLPAADDIQGQAEYWFKVYNGSGVEKKKADYIAHYREFIG